MLVNLSSFSLLKTIFFCSGVNLNGILIGSLGPSHVKPDLGHGVPIQEVGEVRPVWQFNRIGIATVFSLVAKF